MQLNHGDTQEMFLLKGTVDPKINIMSFSHPNVVSESRPV